jgi:hypothetical protein
LERLIGAEDQTRNKPTHVLKSFGATKDLSKTLHPLGNDLGHTNDRQHGSISLLLFHSLIFYYPSILLNNLPSRVKQMFKIKRPIGESENALPVQIVSAFVSDVLLRAFKHSSGFTSTLYEFVSTCQELSLVPLKELTNRALRRAVETIFRLFDDINGVKSTLQLAA